MKNYNHKLKAPCEFTETLVALLYDEATAAEKREFEMHSRNCPVCLEEIISFGQVRNAVSEWREIDFASLETPAIQLPIEENTFVGLTVKSSWRKRLSQVLLPNGGFWQRAPVFAGFLFVGLLTIFGYSIISRVDDSNSNQEIAAKTDFEKSISGSNNNAQSSQNSNSTSGQINPTERVNKPENSDKPELKPAPKPAKSTNSGIKPALQPLPTVRSNKNPSKVVPSRSEDLTVETIDDLEDNSLRLSDLLEDVTPSR